MRGTLAPWGAFDYSKSRPPRDTGRANLPDGSSRRLRFLCGRRLVCGGKSVPASVALVARGMAHDFSHTATCAEPGMP